MLILHDVVLEAFPQLLFWTIIRNIREGAAGVVGFDSSAGAGGGVGEVFEAGVADVFVKDLNGAVEV